MPDALGTVAVSGERAVDVTDTEELALATRVLADHDLIGMYGHVSVLPDPAEDRYLLSPGVGFRKELCRCEDVVELSFDDVWCPGWPLELFMHSEVQRRRPEIRAVVHTHAPALTELSLLDPVPGDALLLHAAFWPGPVPVYEQPRLVVERAQAEELAEVIGDASVTLLRWHLDRGDTAVSLPRGAARGRITEKIITERMLALHWDYERSGDARRHPDGESR